MAPNPPNPLTAALAKYPSLDQKAVLAVAKQEGLGGGIGDQGTSFGPFQLHYGGAYPSSAPQGAQASQQWAWSPEGLAYALSRIQSVAGGLKGGQAVNAIVSRFERPANPGREIAGALSAYGLPAGSGGSPAGSMGGGGGGGGGSPQLLQTLLATRRAVGLDAPSPAFRALMAAHPQQQQQQAVAPPVQPVGPLRLANIGGIQVNAAVAPTVAQIVRQFGVTPTSGYRSPGHNQAVGGASNSDHLHGNAVDFSGTPQQMAALYRYAQGRFPYVEPMAQAQNHVHISFTRGG